MRGIYNTETRSNRNGFPLYPDLCAIILDVAPETETRDLTITAQRYRMSAAMTLGLGAGVYFEYFRQLHGSPTRFISGLHRELEKTLVRRADIFADDPRSALRDALRENALWFILDRAPTNGLLGMEMLAEELPHLAALADRRECVTQMARTIQTSHALYRETYATFLERCSSYFPGAANLAPALHEIAGEWHEFSIELTVAAQDPSRLEPAGRRLRRLALREEHFWGSVLELQ